MATPAQPKPAVIRVDPMEGRNGWGETLHAVPAWIISAAIHGGLILLFYLVVGDPMAMAKEDKDAAPQTETINTKIEAPETKDLPLTSVDEGIDPEVPTNYDVNRIEEVSVPGPVDPNAAVGIAGAPEGPPVNIPPPPGSGRGQGGAPDLPDVAGTGMMGREMIGGFRGLSNVPGGFAGRSGATREKMATEGGGSAASEACVGRGLKWLALHQAPEGHWALDAYNLHARPDVNSNRFFIDPNATGKGQKNDTAGAAFGLLPFLAAGITHKPSGKPQDDQYVKTVGRALTYLIRKQGKEGEFPGGMYAHGLATIAICEAYGLTADPMLKRPAQAALNYIILAQDTTGGGWRYQPRQGGDTSVVGWQVMALKSGQMSGLNVPNITLKLAEKWLDSCETTDGGGFGYTGPQETPTMSAVGCLCREYLGTPRRNPNLQNGVKKLMATPPAAHKNIYYQYYATQVFHHMGGEFWDFWNKGPGGKNGMRDVLVNSQDKDGSWNPAGDGHSGAGGRIMQTSLSLLTLEVYYRHLPLYQRVDTKK
jgi:hypothetical protein